MANICSCFMEITGEKEEIAILIKKIVDEDKELFELFCWFEEDKDYGRFFFQNTEESINISFTSKWRFPFAPFASLVAAYPRLIFEVFYEETECMIFGKTSGVDGLITDTPLTPLDYYSEFSEDFNSERQQIEKLPYKEFLYDCLEEFVMTDQPEECRHCGTRTEFEEFEGYQVHECPKDTCGARYKLIKEEKDGLEEKD